MIDTAPTDAGVISGNHQTQVTPRSRRWLLSDTPDLKRSASRWEPRNVVNERGRSALREGKYPQPPPTPVCA